MSDTDPQQLGVDASVDVFGSEIDNDQLFSGAMSRFEILQLEHMSLARRLNRTLVTYAPRRNIRSVLHLSLEHVVT